MIIHNTSLPAAIRALYNDYQAKQKEIVELRKSVKELTEKFAALMKLLLKWIIT